MHTRKLFLCATGLLMAGSLMAHVTTSADHVKHKDINFKTVTARYVFQDGTGAHWSALPNGGYEVVLKQNAANNGPDNTDGATSLLTLGLQGVDSPTEIKLESGTDVEIYDTTKTNPRWEKLGNQKVAVGRTGTVQGANGKLVVDDNRVGFIRYKGDTCKLTVTSGKDRRGITKWHGHGPQQLTSHDNTPPGLPPGGEGGN